MRKYARIGILCLILTIAGFWGVLLSENASAKPISSDSLYKLSIMRGVRKCYNLYGKGSISGEDYGSYLSIFDVDGGFGKTGSSDIWITTHVGNERNTSSNEKDSNMSCKQVFEGYDSSMKGLKSYYPSLESANLETMGYYKTGETESAASNIDVDNRVRITINPADIKNENSNFGLDLTVDGGGIECFADGKKSSVLLGTSWKNLRCNGQISIEGNNTVLFSLQIQGTSSIASGYNRDPVEMVNTYDVLLNAIGANKTLAENFEESKFSKRLIEDIEQALIAVGYTNPSATVSYSSDFPVTTGKYEPINSSLTSASEALLYNLGVDNSLPNNTSQVDGHSAANYLWNNDYIYSLYYRYLQDAMKRFPSVKINTCSETKGDEGGFYFKNTPDQWCRVQIPSDSENALSEVYSIVSGEDLAKGTFKDILNWFSEENSYAGVSENVYANSRVDKNGNVVVENEEDSVCFENSGAIGWIICPIIEGASRVGTAMWDFIETDFLQIRAEDLFRSNGVMDEVWQKFRDIANIIFIILFLVVIFSQLTGVGIDNYGIKKIMPRLIVVAILVNLSFLICALAVDISNVLGAGLNALFTSLAGDIPSSVTSLAPTESSLGSILATVGIGAGGIALFGILNPVGALTVGGVFLGIGLAVLVIVITIVFSILFMFIILIIRDAGVVILIAISPIAIVCYMLPNTERLCKRWLDLFRALLVVYPICGALIGAGKLAANLLASIPNSPGMVIAGMIMNVLPFFLVPMLLRQSLSLMGNIGARISSFGHNAGRRAGAFARDKITDSEAVKDWSQAQKTQADVRRANRIMGRLNGRTNLSPRNQERLRNAQDVILARRKAEQENDIRTRGGYMEAMTHKQELGLEAEADAIARLNDPVVQEAERRSLANEARLKRDKAQTTLLLEQTQGQGLDQLMDGWNTAFNGGDADRLSAMTNVINQRYGTSGAERIATSLNTKRNIASNPTYQTSMRTLQQTMNDNSSFANNMKTKSPDAFQMIGDAGMRYDNATRSMVQEDMEYFTNHNGIATKASDWAMVSGSALQRGLDAKKDNGDYLISNDMINTLLTSQDPTIMSGLQSEDKKREMLEAALYNRETNPSGIGPNLPNAVASNARQSRIQNQQRDEERMRQHEEDAKGRGKTNVVIPPSIISGTPSTTIQGYEVPSDIRATNGLWTRSPEGDYIYNGANGKQWNASTGRYVRPQPPNTP